MKMNKWTMALAAAGVVSLSSVAQAQEAAAGANALAASTTLSGYVSTSWKLYACYDFPERSSSVNMENPFDTSVSCAISILSTISATTGLPLGRAKNG